MVKNNEQWCGPGVCVLSVASTPVSVTTYDCCCLIIWQAKHLAGRANSITMQWWHSCKRFGFLCCDTEETGEINHIAEVPSLSLRLNPSVAPIGYPVLTYSISVGNPFPPISVNNCSIILLIHPECPKLITWLPCALLLQRIHTYRNSKPKNQEPQVSLDVKSENESFKSALSSVTLPPRYRPG